MSQESFPEPNPNFDDFLSQIEDDQQQGIERAARIEAMSYQIGEALLRHGVETVFNVDLTIDPEKERELLEQLTHEFYVAFTEKDYYIDSDRVAHYAEEHLQKIEIDQELLFTKVKMLIVAFNDSQAEVSQEEKTAYKRKIIADWIITQSYEIDSSWVNFLNEILPGDDFTAEVADEYLHPSIVEELSAIEWRKKASPAIRKAIESTGKELTVEQVSGLAMIAMIRQDSYEMQARLDETARTIGLTTSEGQEFVKTLRAELDAEPRTE